MNEINDKYRKKVKDFSLKSSAHFDQWDSAMKEFTKYINKCKIYSVVLLITWLGTMVASLMMFAGTSTYWKIFVCLNVLYWTGHFVVIKMIKNGKSILDGYEEKSNEISEDYKKLANEWINELRDDGTTNC